MPSKPYPSAGPPFSPTGHSEGPIFFSLVSIPSGGASVPPLILPTYPPIPSTPLPPVQIAPSLVNTHIYLISITFFPGPDEVATVWWLKKFICDLNALTALFQQSRTFNIYPLPDFFKCEQHYLGHLISGKGIYLLPEK